MLDLLHPVNAVGAIRDYLDAGGPVVSALLVSTFAMWALIIERLLYFAFVERGAVRARRAAWEARSDHSTWFAHAVRERLISEQRLAVEQNLTFIRVLIMVTPLLGLLGTVTGMIEVFDVITATGSSNARLMASGISRATIPTMTGLAVSLSGILLINFLERHGARTVARLGDSLDVHAAPDRSGVTA